MPFDFKLGGSSSSNTIDPKSRAAMFGNISQANSLPAFEGLTPGLLSQFRDPYEDQAVRGMLGDLEYQRQLAGNTTGDAALAGGAFGGSRHGVADALTNSEFARHGGLISSQMRSQGHWNSVQSALQQLLAKNQYGLLRQGVQTDALRALIPNTKSKSMQFQFGAGGGAPAGGGGGGQMSPEMMQQMMAG